MQGYCIHYLSSLLIDMLFLYITGYCHCFFLCFGIKRRSKNPDTYRIFPANAHPPGSRLLGKLPLQLIQITVRKVNRPPALGADQVVVMPEGRRIR
jgi:hypothetical protein